MIKYVFAGNILKFFSCSTFTKHIYRILGNTIGAYKRTYCMMPRYYYERIQHMLWVSQKYGIPKDGHKFLEIGTGWLHWEAITTRLFFDIDAVLYDVWDNRQLKGIKNYLSQLINMLDNLDIKSSKIEEIHIMIEKIQKVKSYSELYELLGFKYIIDKNGLMNNLEKESFDFIVSKGVLEHIDAGIIPEFVNNISSLLKPGGYSLHSINLRDHLYEYDRSVSVKQYLNYSDETWKRIFCNDIQYINRVQRPEWLKQFEKSGLILVEEQVVQGDIKKSNIASKYQKYNLKDLTCIVLIILHIKPI